MRDIAASTGSVVDHVDYDSFGNVVAESNSVQGDRYKFTGRELDPSTDLYYFRARYYDSHTGRFISEDPIDFAAGDSNLYRYVSNRPLTATDPSGLEAMISYPAFVDQAVQVANAMSGYALGYVCGYAEAAYLGNPNPEAAARNSARPERGQA